MTRHRYRMSITGALSVAATGPAASVAPGLFVAVDANKDDVITREELKSRLGPQHDLH